jgi:hypothetical protein
MVAFVYFSRGLHGWPLVSTEELVGLLAAVRHAWMELVGFVIGLIWMSPLERDRVRGRRHCINPLGFLTGAAGISSMGVGGADSMMESLVSSALWVT